MQVTQYSTDKTINMKNFWFSILFIIVGTLYSNTSFSQCGSCGTSPVYDIVNCLTVTTTTDNINTTAASCDGSLRWAILKANQLAGGTYIKFSLPGALPYVINLNAPLVITNRVYIDGGSASNDYTYGDVYVWLDFQNSNFTTAAIVIQQGSDYSNISYLGIRNINGPAVDVFCSATLNDNVILSKPNTAFPSDIHKNHSIGLYDNFASASRNYIGFYPKGTTSYIPDNAIVIGKSSLISYPDNNNNRHTLSQNTIRYNRNGILVKEETNFECDEIYISENLFVNTGLYGGSKNINLYTLDGNDPNFNMPKPVITSVTNNSISGTYSGGRAAIEIYKSDNNGISALVYLGTRISNTAGIWSFSYTVSGGETFIATATTQNGQSAQDIMSSSEFSDPVTYVCPTEIKILNLPSVICKSTPSITLLATPTGGTFSGNGISGNIFNPSSLNDGIYTIYYGVLGCSTLQKVLIPKVMPAINRVISATSTTYSDTWPIDYANLKIVQDVDQVSNVTLTINKRNTLESANEVANGTKGIWHGEETYTYVEKREQHTPVTIKEDGIFNDMPLFDHTSAMNGGCTPKWRLMNTITEYNPSSYDTENKDILNRYSAALFGYKGDLPIAVAANAREREIAFESFEEYTPGALLRAYNLSAGNFTFNTNSSTVESDYFKVYRSYEIIEAIDNKITVDAPLTTTSAWNGKILKVVGAGMNSYNEKEIYGNYAVVSVAAHASDLSKSVITLSSATFLYSGIWKGKVSFPNDYSSNKPVSSGASNLSIVTTKKHTGKNSLKSVNNVRLEQMFVDLIPGEKYVLGAWVSTDVSNYTYRMLSGTERRGFTIYFYSSTGTNLGTTQIDIDDRNPVIEGWQKIEGVFTYPANATKLQISFDTPSGVSTYWDDIRLFPFNGNIQTYVYDKLNYKVSAVLDNNNYASLYYYDAQGNLFLVKKETEKGIQTIQESFSHQKE